MSAASRILVAAAAVLLVLGAHAAPRGVPVSPVAGQFDPPSKPTGPISVDYRLAETPALAMPLTITVTARAEAGAGRLLLQTSSSDSAALWVSAAAPVAASEGAQAWVLTVVPLLATPSHLQITVAGDIDGVPQARTVVIPIRVAGDVASPPRVEQSDGEALILLPVTESP